MATAVVKTFGMKQWVTRQLREDVPALDAVLRSELQHLAGRQGYAVLPDTFMVEWRDRDSDPLVMTFLADDDPRREMWARGDLFLALASARVARTP